MSVKRLATVLFDYEAASDNEVCAVTGDVVSVLDDTSDAEWVLVERLKPPYLIGHIPRAYIQYGLSLLSSPLSPHENGTIMPSASTISTTTTTGTDTINNNNNNNGTYNMTQTEKKSPLSSRSQSFEVRLGTTVELSNSFNYGSDAFDDNHDSANNKNDGTTCTPREQYTTTTTTTTTESFPS